MRLYPRIPAEAPPLLEPRHNFRLARQRSYCTCSTKQPLLWWRKNLFEQICFKLRE